MYKNNNGNNNNNNTPVENVTSVTTLQPKTARRGASHSGL